MEEGEFTTNLLDILLNRNHFMYRYTLIIYLEIHVICFNNVCTPIKHLLAGSPMRSPSSLPIFAQSTFPSSALKDFPLFYPMLCQI